MIVLVKLNCILNYNTYLECILANKALLRIRTIRYISGESTAEMRFRSETAVRLTELSISR